MEKSYIIYIMTAPSKENSRDNITKGKKYSLI